MQIFIATLGVILGFVGLHAHLLGLIAVPARAFPTDQQTGAQRLVQVNPLTPAFLFLLSFSTEKNIRIAQAGTRRSVRPTLLKVQHLCVASKGSRKSPEKW